MGEIVQLALAFGPGSSYAASIKSLIVQTHHIMFAPASTNLMAPLSTWTRGRRSGSVLQGFGSEVRFASNRREGVSLWFSVPTLLK